MFVDMPAMLMMYKQIYSAFLRPKEVLYVPLQNR